MDSRSKPLCDDNAVEEEPAHNVDYLSHVWREDDIWVTRRYVLQRKRALKNSTRLENALWRTWTKHKLRLKTASPRLVNWAKDSDITWLYGPWKSTDPSPTMRIAAPQNIREGFQSTRSTKPSLKRGTSASLLSCTLRAAAHRGDGPVVAEKNSLQPGGDRAWFIHLPRLALRQVASTVHPGKRSWRFWSWLPSVHQRKVHFDKEVRQCIAIDSACMHDVCYEEESSPSQNTRFVDGRQITGVLNPPDGRLFGTESPGQTITQLPSTGLKSPDGPVDPARENVDDMDVEDDISLL